MVTTTKASDLKAMTDEALAEYMSGWKESTGNYILCEMEFKRRQNKDNAVRGWLSLAISLIAICVSVVALATRHTP